MSLGVAMPYRTHFRELELVSRGRAREKERDIMKSFVPVLGRFTYRCWQERVLIEEPLSYIKMDPGNALNEFLRKVN